MYYHLFCLMPPSPRRNSSTQRTASLLGGQFSSRGGRGHAEPSADCGHTGSLPPLQPTSLVAPTESLFHPLFGPGLVEAVLAALCEASANRALEDAAAQKIQATFRMWCQRRRYTVIWTSVVTMQKVYRGHLERHRRDARAAENEHAYQLEVFGYYATRIQACFRGHYSRRNVDDFYARKRYIWETTKASETVRTVANVLQEEWNTLNAIARQEADTTLYINATEKAHPLLSTSGVSGVYRKNRYLTGTNTVFESNVEDDIRIHASAAREPEVVKQFEYNATHNWQHPKVPPAAPVGLKSISGPLGARRALETQSAPQSKVLDGDTAAGQRPEGDRSPLAPATKGQSATGGSRKVPYLPPIVGDRKPPRRRSPQPTPSHYLPCASAGPSCAWDLEETRPHSHPLIAPNNRIALTIQAKTATSPPLPLPATSVLSEKVRVAVSSTNPKFTVQEHGCVSLDAGPVYDAQPAAIKRAVDAKVRWHLHGDAAFKVSAGRGTR